MHSTPGLLGPFKDNLLTGTRPAQAPKKRTGNITRFVPFLLFLLFFSASLSAQNTTDRSSFRARTDFKAGYFGNFGPNHGLNLGAEYLWLEKVKVKERRRGQKTVKRQLLLNGSLGYSTSFATQTQNGIFAYSGLTLRKVNAKSWEFSLEINPLGLYRSVLPDTYEVVDDEVSSVSFPGRSFYAPSLAIGIGRFQKGRKRTGWYLNFQRTVLRNYNAGYLTIGSIHFGRRF